MYSSELPETGVSGRARPVQRKKNGEEMYVFSSVTATLDQEGNPVRGLIAVNRDITKRKLTEQALQESEANSRALLEALPDFNVPTLC